MNKKDCFYLGKISRTHGTSGQLQIFLDVDNPYDYSKLDAVLLDKGTLLIPYIIENINIIKDNKAIVTIEGIKTLEQAQNILGYDLYLPLSILKPLKGNKFYFHEVIGFEIKDKKHGNIGKINEIYDMHSTPIFSIIQKETEILIPVIDSIIKKVDRTNRRIEIEAPEGLIELYISPQSE